MGRLFLVSVPSRKISVRPPYQSHLSSRFWRQEKPRRGGTGAAPQPAGVSDTRPLGAGPKAVSYYDGDKRSCPRLFRRAPAFDVRHHVLAEPGRDEIARVCHVMEEYGRAIRRVAHFEDAFRPLEASLARLEAREGPTGNQLLGLLLVKVASMLAEQLNTRPLGPEAPGPALHKAIYRGEGIPGDALILVSLLRAHDDTPLRYGIQRARMQLAPRAVVHGHLLTYPCLRYLLRHRSSLVRGPHHTTRPGRDGAARFSDGRQAPSSSSQAT